ncbi:U32 family peptidase C-terminal domain-containing protein [Patescibacteria group bacterium]|nr:U32 family peptidase C-terminal domain-containing protein [Patescibacteria group bacterium]
MKLKERQIELLAPAGTMGKLNTAFSFGADAVYVGLPAYSLRTRINDFNLENIRLATEFSHKEGKKIYATINIFAHNFHFKRLPEYIRELKDIGVDALIVADAGIIKLVQEVWPTAVIHLSTQANCTNYYAAKFWYDLGIKRVILGREIELNAIKEIHTKLPELELEIFAHGAMCMAYSGRCFISKQEGARSANLGVCNNACRFEYKQGKIKTVTIRADNNDEMEIVEDEHGSHIINSKDLCLVRRIPELLESGIISLKVEGRTKSAYYVANVIGMYRQAINLSLDKSIPPDILIQKLEFFYQEFQDKLVNRGYTEGFYFNEGQMAQTLEGSHNLVDWEFAGEVVGVGDNENEIVIKVHNSLKVGDEIEIVKPYYDIINMKVKKMMFSKSGEDLLEAHGGQSKAVILIVDEKVVEGSVIRRKLT